MTEQNIEPDDLAVYDTAVGAPVPGPAIPVHVAGPIRVAPQEPRRYTTTARAVTTTPVRLANDVPTRTRMLVSASGAGAATLARTQAECSSGNGFILPAGVAIEIGAGGELWAADYSGGAGVTVSALVETTD